MANAGAQKWDYCAPRINYADVRQRVGNAFVEKANEISDAIAVVQGLSKEATRLLGRAVIFFSFRWDGLGLLGMTCAWVSFGAVASVGFGIRLLQGCASRHAGLPWTLVIALLSRMFRECPVKAFG